MTTSGPTRATTRAARLVATCLTFGLVDPAAAQAFSSEQPDSVARADSTVGPAPTGAQSIVEGNLRVIHWPGQQALARQIATAAGSALRLPALPSGVLEFPPEVRIFLAPDPARFDSLTGGRAPEWGAGVALPEASIIVLPGFSSIERGALQDLGPVLRHELAHIALHRYLGDVQVPRWFSEGYATWAAGQLDTDAAWLLRLAFLTGRAPPLDSLALDWPEATTDARIAYLLSASAVAFLHETGGERGLALLLAEWRDSGSFEAALRATYLLTPAQLEEYWSRAVRRRYGWLLFFAQTAVIWVVISAIVLVLFVIRRRRNRRKMEQLRATEPPDQPAYWLETGPNDTSDEPGTPAEPPPDRQPPRE